MLDSQIEDKNIKKLYLHYLKKRYISISLLGSAKEEIVNKI